MVAMVDVDVDGSWSLSEGTLVRGSTGLHAHCGSDACSANPCGDRTTTAQRRSLERATSEVANEKKMIESACAASRERR